MVGQGVLQECLRSGEVEGVLSIGRRAGRQSHPKLREIAHQDQPQLFNVVEELSIAAGLSAADTVSLLARFEVEGKIVRGPGGYYQVAAH